MVYRLDNQGVAGEPVIAIACEQPNPMGSLRAISR